MSVAGIRARKRGAAGWWWGAWLAAILVATSALPACGEKAAAFDGIVTAVLAVEQQPDGTLVPIPNAGVTMKLYAPTITVIPLLLQEYAATTDAQGLAAVVRNPEGKNDTEINVLFVDVELPDGRTGFSRQKLDTRFDFEAWLKQHSPNLATRDAMAARICSAASDYPDCQKILKSRKLTTWGVAVVVTIRPSA